jgi:hypothetical protein
MNCSARKHRVIHQEAINLIVEKNPCFLYYLFLKTRLSRKWQYGKDRRLDCVTWISARFYVRTDKTGMGKLEVTNCDLKLGRHTVSAVCITEQGVAMLSGILRSAHAIQVNIAIMRAFVQLRLFLESNMEFARKLDELEKAVAGHDEKIGMIFQAIRQMIGKKEEPLPPRRPIGY